MPNTVVLPAWDVEHEGCMPVKAYDSRLIVQSVWLSGLYTPQVVDLGGVAPPHIGVTQYTKKA